MTIDEVYAELKRINTELSRISAEAVKNRRSTEDAINNLDLANMPSVAKIIQSSSDGLASLTTTVDEYGSSINGIAYFVDPLTGVTSYASESLIASINGSSYSIIADNIDFTGFTTFALSGDLDNYATLAGLNNGETIVNGNCVTTGVLDTDLLKVDGYGYSTIPNLNTQNIVSGDDNGLYFQGYSSVDIIAQNSDLTMTVGNSTGNLYLSTPYSKAYYNGVEIATLNDVPNVSSIESDISSLEYYVWAMWEEMYSSDTGIMARLEALEM